MAIEWRKREDQALCIEWHKPKNKEHSGSVLIEEITQAVDADDEVKIIEVRYPLPRWLRRLDLYERYQQVPEYLKYINVSAFHNACGESHYALPIHTAANITDLPEWLQRMHTCGDQQRDQQTSFINHKIPGWMKRIRFNKDFFLDRIPSWMSKINLVDAEDERIDEEHLRHQRPNYDYRIKGSNSWASPRYAKGASEWISTTSWVRPITSESSLLNNASSLCNSVINFAMVLATATCKAAESQAASLTRHRVVAEEESLPKTTVTKKKKRVLAGQSTCKHVAKKSAAKKNKKWLNKVNTINKLEQKNKRQRYAPRSFSGRKSVRAC